MALQRVLNLLNTIPANEGIRSRREDFNGSLVVVTSFFFFTWFYSASGFNIFSASYVDGFAFQFQLVS